MHVPVLVPVDSLNDFPFGQENEMFAVGSTGGFAFVPVVGLLPGVVGPDGDSVIVCSDAARAGPLQNMTVENANVSSFIGRIRVFLFVSKRYSITRNSLPVSVQKLTVWRH